MPNKAAAQMNIQISEAYDKIVRLGEALGVTDIKSLPGAWVQKVDEHWTFALNGRDEPVRVTPDEDSMSWTLRFGDAVVWRDGYVVGGLVVDGGMFIGGRESYEDAFIAALDRAIERASKKSLTI